MEERKGGNKGGTKYSNKDRKIYSLYVRILDFFSGTHNFHKLLFYILTYFRSQTAYFPSFAHFVHLFHFLQRPIDVILLNTKFPTTLPYRILFSLNYTRSRVSLDSLVSCAISIPIIKASTSSAHF